MAIAEQSTPLTLANHLEFRRDALVVIAGIGPASGQRIAGELEEYYAGEVTHARLYTNLDALVECGYVEKGEFDARTNSYELTEDGRQALENRREWEAQYLDDSEVDA